MEAFLPPTPIPRRSARRTWTPLVTAALLGGLFALWLAWRIPQGTLLNTDELLTAERSREMSLPSGSPWLVRFNFQPSFSKPPLQYWLTASVLRRSMKRETAVRLWPSIYALLAVSATGWLARVLDPRRPWLAPLGMALFVASPLVLAEAGRALLDVGLTLFVTLMVGAVLRARQTRNVGWLAVAGVACWLATLQKNPLGLLCWLLLAAAGWMTRSRTPATPDTPASDASWWRRESAVFLLVAMAATGWPLLQLLVQGMSADDVFGWAEASRLRGQSRLGRRSYFEILDRLITCWAWGVPALLAAAWPFLAWLRRGRREPGDDPSTESRVVAVAFLCLVFLGLATLESFRSVRYVLPVMPCLCVLLACGLHRSFEMEGRWRRVAAAALVMTLVAVDLRHVYHNYGDWFIQAPEQRAAAVRLGETHRRVGKKPMVVVVRPSKDDDDDSRESLLGSFYLFYGDLSVPVQTRSIEQLRGETLPRQAMIGVCRARDLAGLRGVLTGMKIDGEHGDFILWNVAAPE